MFDNAIHLRDLLALEVAQSIVYRAVRVKHLLRLELEVRFEFAVGDLVVPKERRAGEIAVLEGARGWVVEVLLVLAFFVEGPRSALIEVVARIREIAPVVQFENRGRRQGTPGRGSVSSGERAKQEGREREWTGGMPSRSCMSTPFARQGRSRRLI